MSATKQISAKDLTTGMTIRHLGADWSVLSIALMPDPDGRVLTEIEAVDQENAPLKGVQPAEFPGDQLVLQVED